MKHRAIRLSFAPLHLSFATLIASLEVAGSAHAAYLCDAPPTSLDKRACEAAERGPDALRRFTERLRSIRNLYFYDYVNEARQLAWDGARERSLVRTQAAATPDKATRERR